MKENPVPINTDSAFHKSTLCFYVFASSGHFISMSSYNLWLLISVFFHLAQCFQGSSILACINTSFLYVHIIYIYIYRHKIFYYTTIPHFVHSSVDRHFGFCLWAIVNNAAMNIYVQVFLWMYIFHLSWVYT